jgi:hypothetical protein
MTSDDSLIKFLRVANRTVLITEARFFFYFRSQAIMAPNQSVPATYLAVVVRSCWRRLRDLETSSTWL